MVKGPTSEASKASASEVNDIESISVNDSDWRCTVGFLVDANSLSMPYSKLIPEAIASGKRRVIYSISFLDIIKTIKQRPGCSPTNSKSAAGYGDIFIKLCSEALSYENEANKFSIPSRVLASLLKVKILQIKAEAIRRSEMLADLAKRKEEDDQIIFARKSDPNPFKDTKSNKNGKPKTKGVDEQHSVSNCPSKRNTKLRRRGEEWLDIEYIEDSPEDGPDAYIIISNFYDAKLTYELLRIGVPLQCVIKLELEILSDVETSSSNSISPLESVTHHEGNQHRDTTISMNPSYRDTEVFLNRVSSSSRMTMMKVSELVMFWNELAELMYEPETRILYKEVASLTLTIPESLHPASDSAEQLELKHSLYDQVSWLMYDLHDIIKQHELFLKNLVRRSIPNAQNESSMDVYSIMLDSIPNECCDVLIIVNCIVEQVIASVEYSELSAEDYLTLREEEQATDIPENDCVEKKLQMLSENYAMVETPTLLNPDPLVLSFSDRLLKRNYHYDSKHVDIENVAYNFFKCMPLFTLWDEYKINEVKIYEEHIKLVGEYISSEPVPYNVICCYIYVYLFYNMYCSDEIRMKQERLEKSQKKMECREKVNRKDKHIPQTVEEWCATIVSDIIISAKDEKKSNAKPLPNSSQSLRSESNKQTFNTENTQGKRSVNMRFSNSESKGKVQLLEKTSSRSVSNKLTFSVVNDQKNKTNVKNFESGVHLGKAQSWSRSKDQSNVSWKSKSSIARLSTRHRSSMVKRTQSGLTSSRSLQKCKTSRKSLLRIPELTEDKLKYQVLSEFLKYRMMEEMNSVVFLQAIRNASEEFYDVEHFYFDATDSILLRFFNPRCKNGFTERGFENYLTTACGLKDFCDYVLGNEWTWFEEEQEEKIIATTSLTSVMNIAPEISPYPFYIDADFIIPNSIKWKILYNDTVPLTQPYSESTVEKNHGATRTKTDTAVGSIYSNNSSSADLTSDENKERGNGPSPVYGYDLGFDLRAQFSATHSICNLEDGCNVKVNVTEQLYFRKSVCLQVKMFDFTFTYNYQLWPKVQGSEKGDSFFVQSNSGVRMFFKKSKDVEWVNPEVGDLVREVRFDLQLSWENGLHVTLIKNDLTDAVEYVSQTYIVHHKVRSNIENERKRCYLRNGEILKFLSNESIVLLCADGRIFTFTLEKTPAKRVPSGNIVIDKASLNTIPDYHKKKRKSKLKAFSPDVETRTSASPAMHDIVDEIAQPLFHVKEYSVLLPNGSYITNKDGYEKEEENKFLVRTSTDVGGGEVFVRRSDGTNILERADGLRVVAFPDGSRITSIITIEDEEIFCEWMYSEIYQFSVVAVNIRVFGNREDVCDTILLLDEGYVSVLLTHIMEHPNYATVTYKGDKLPIELSSAGDIKVSVYPDNVYDVKLCDVDLSIKGNCIKMSREDSCNANIELFTETNVSNYSLNLCTVENNRGDCFFVKNDGSCSFVEKDDVCPRNYRNEKCSCSTEKVHCPCSLPLKPNSKNFNYKDQRCFVLNRKLSGVELIHEDELNSHVKEVQSTRNGRVAVLRQDYESDLCYIVAMKPFVVNESEKWLVPCEKARITREERELFTCLPSTYGAPPSWFHRFPLTAEETTNVECYEPNMLEIRLFQEIFPPETDVISTTWSALNNYYNTSLQDIEPYENKFPFGNNVSEKCLTVPDKIRIESQRRTSPAAGRIYQLAMFYTTTKEEPEAYRSWVRHKASWAVSKSTLDQRLRREKSNRKAFRENVFPPYFSSPEAENYYVGERIKKR